MCSICFENFKPYEALYSTDCGHIYHFHCMQQWQSRSSSCPQCRTYKPKTHRIYLELKDMTEYDVQKYNEAQQQLNKYHVELMKLKEGLSRLAEEKRDLEETLKDTLAHNETLRVRLETLEMKLHLDYINIKYDINNNNNNNNNNNTYEEQGAELEHKMQESNGSGRAISIREQPQHQKKQQQEPIVQLKSSPTDRLSIWFIRQTSQGNCELKGPFKTISDGIIAAKKQILHETSLTIAGIDDTKVNIWMDWLREIQLSSNLANTMSLEARDVIKTHYVKQAHKLFIQFRTAEWRNFFLQVNDNDDDNNNNNNNNNDGYSSGSDINCGNCDYNTSSAPHSPLGVRFTTEILPKPLASYDTLYEYAKTLKVVGFKSIYGHRGNIFVRRCKSSPSIMIKNKKQVDDLIKTELNL